MHKSVHLFEFLWEEINSPSFHVGLHASTGRQLNMKYAGVATCLHQSLLTHASFNHSSYRPHFHETHTGILITSIFPSSIHPAHHLFILLSIYHLSIFSLSRLTSYHLPHTHTSNRILPSRNLSLFLKTI